MALTVIDRAMQVHGAEGISQDQPLAYMYASLRTLRYADVSGGAACTTLCFYAETQGPDEVHIQQIGKAELKRVEELRQRAARVKSREAKL